MAKDKFWFKHDYEPTGDPKIQALVADYGGFGYGVYWRIVEMLHSDAAHKLPLKQYIFIAIAKQMEANAKQNKANIKLPEILPEQIHALLSECINVYELFHSDGTFFWSNRVFRNIDDKNTISVKRAESGSKGGKAKNDKANAKQSLARRGEERREEYNNLNIIAESVPPPPPHVFFPKATAYNGLPTHHCENVIRLVKVVKKIDVEKDDVDTLWEVFKNQHLTGEKPYHDDNDVYRHFINWAKGHAFKKGAKPRKGNKSDEKIFGVEYVNDFSQCKMSDGSIQELSPNQRDSAKFQGIKPSVIQKK